MVKVINPLQDFILWFDSLPVHHRKFLAHLYRVCTTDSTIDMVMDPDKSLELFRNSLLTTDFPLRTCARVFQLRGIFDLMLMNYKTLISDMGDLFQNTDVSNVSMLSPHQWEKTLETWRGLRSKELSDNTVHFWTREILQQKNKNG